MAGVDPAPPCRRPLAPPGACPRGGAGADRTDRSGADDPLANDYTDEMQRALDRLPSEIRETLLLVVVGELTHQEVADLLKIPLGTVLSRVSRGRVRLREFWLTEARMNAG